jgi:hypothetical protein
VIKDFNNITPKIHETAFVAPNSMVIGDVVLGENTTIWYNAVLRGDYVLIETDNDLFKSLVTRDGNKAVLADAIRGVTGRACRIGIKKKQAAQAELANDPLASFIRNSRDLGVNLEVK